MRTSIAFVASILLCGSFANAQIALQPGKSQGNQRVAPQVNKQQSHGKTQPGHGYQRGYDSNNNYGKNSSHGNHGNYPSNYGHSKWPYATPYAIPYMVPYFVPPDPIYIPPPREGSYLDRQAKAKAAKLYAPPVAPAAVTPVLSPAPSSATPYDKYMRQARGLFISGKYREALMAAKHSQLENDTSDVQELLVEIGSMAGK